MRRLLLVALVACLATGLALAISLFAVPPKVSQASKQDNVVRVAKKYIGTDYRWDTCKRRHMNCACLTQTVFAKFGYDLPLSPDMQWELGRKVSHPEPGDLVFFEEGGPKTGITHVGIYSGNGYLIHASGYFDEVVESEMKYIRGYKGARRL